MDRGRVGEDRGSKETDGCPLTAPCSPYYIFGSTCDTFVVYRQLQNLGSAV
jgi:hypothetical protein